MGFDQELQTLIAKYYTPSSTYEDFVRVETAMRLTLEWLQESADRFSDLEMGDGIDRLEQTDPEAFKRWLS